MDPSTKVILALFVVGWFMVYGRRMPMFQRHSCSNHDQPGNYWNKYRGTEFEPVLNNQMLGIPANPTPRQLGLSTGVLSGKPCTPHQAVHEHRMNAFYQTFGRFPDNNEIAPGVWQWQTDGGSTYTTNTRDGS